MSGQHLPHCLIVRCPRGCNRQTAFERNGGLFQCLQQARIELTEREVDLAARGVCQHGAVLPDYPSEQLAKAAQRDGIETPACHEKERVARGAASFKRVDELRRDHSIHGQRPVKVKSHDAPIHGRLSSPDSLLHAR